MTEKKIKEVIYILTFGMCIAFLVFVAYLCLSAGEGQDGIDRAMELLK